MLAHLLAEFLLGSFRLEFRRQVEEDIRIQHAGEAVLEELRRRDLQQRAVVEVGTEKDMLESMSAPRAPVIVGQTLPRSNLTRRQQEKTIRKSTVLTTFSCSMASRA